MNNPTSAINRPADIRNDILQKLYTIDHIPTHPFLKSAITEIGKNTDFSDFKSLTKLAQHISFDPSITIEFLKIANAESFGYRKRISSISNSLLILDDSLINLIISQHPVMPDLLTFRQFLDDYLLLIRHSIEVHVIVQNILDKNIGSIDNDFHDELLTASIIHDIGLLFFLLYFPGDYTAILADINNKETFRKSKDSIMPDHVFIGSVLCELWHFPPSIRTAIAFHHYPWLIGEEFRTGAEIIYLADALSSSFYELYYNEDDIFSFEEHIIMRKQLLDIIEKYEIKIMDVAFLRQESALHVEKILADFKLSSPDA